MVKSIILGQVRLRAVGHDQLDHDQPRAGAAAVAILRKCAAGLVFPVVQTCDTTYTSAAGRFRKKLPLRPGRSARSLEVRRAPDTTWGRSNTMQRRSGSAASNVAHGPVAAADVATIGPAGSR